MTGYRVHGKLLDAASIKLEIALKFRVCVVACVCVCVCVAVGITSDVIP